MRHPLPLILLTLSLLAAPVYARGVAPERVVLPDSVIPTAYDLTVRPDAAAATFTGSVRITLNVTRATADIELNAVDLTFSSVTLSGTTDLPEIRFDTERQSATLHFPSTIGLGRHVLDIRYAGRIGDSGAGLFHLDYSSRHGRQRALYTQLENSYARRLLPCWDEPDRKATFRLSVMAPAQEMVVSNMPIARKVRLAGGLARTTFRTTPKMSVYLLFLGIGDFERLSRPVRGIDVGVVFTRGNADRARFALATAGEVLPYLEDYFGSRFPLPKLDLISGPGRSQEFGAMENWGAIFGFDRYFLLDPRTATQADQLETYSYIAHEMAHQWVGDLVTMDWWNDLWLNEGFAEWMQFKVTDHFHPQWHAWLVGLDERETAMRRDAGAGTHPVITPIANVVQADNAFDAITYFKGMYVLRMLEQYMGEAAFRAGIRHYLHAHAYGNAVSADLWRELDRTGAQPISAIARDFTLQPGVPLIRVTGPDFLHLAQGVFVSAGQAPATKWQVPVAVQPMNGASWQGIIGAAPTDLAQIAAAGTVVNAGEAGYFRTLYAPELIGPLTVRFASLRPEEQFGILVDARALGMAGYEPLPDLLKLAGRVDATVAPQIRSEIVNITSGIAQDYKGLAGEAAYKTYARGLLGHMFADLGWTARPGEAADIAPLRAGLIQALGDLDDAMVMGHSRTLFESYLDDPKTVPSELRTAVLAVVAMHADASVWERIHARAVATRDADERESLYRLLASVADSNLELQTLQLTLTDELEPTAKPDLLNTLAIRHPEQAFDFAVAHRDQVNGWLEPGSRDIYTARLLATSADPAARDRMLQYVAKHVAAADRGPADAVASDINDHIRIRSERLPQIDAWLRAATAADQ